MLQKAPVMPPAGIAVIGLGNMGTPMALCLSRVGFYVTGHDLSEEARQRFSAAGGRAFASANDAAKSADVVIAVLPDGNAVRATFEPLRKDLKPHCVLIDMSSSEPVGTRALGQILIAAGFGFLDAPVSGGVKRAIDGTLAIM